MTQKQRVWTLYGLVLTLWHALFGVVLCRLVSKIGGETGLIVTLNLLTSMVLWLCALSVTIAARKRNDPALLKSLFFPCMIVWIQTVTLLEVIRYFLQDINSTDIVNPLVVSIQLTSFFLCDWFHKKWFDKL